MYYENKIETLSEIFGTSEIELTELYLNVSGKIFPIIDDVIITLKPHQIPSHITAETNLLNEEEEIDSSIGEDPHYPLDKEWRIAKDIQSTFGKEWKIYNEILPEHFEEFKRYFDIIDLKSLESKRICDLGCGIGRWSYFMKDIAKEIVLVDFSESIFEARKHLSGSDNMIFILGDILDLPFQDDTFDFVFSLGVLHHIPRPALQSVRDISRLAPQFLVYIYYALDNRGNRFKSIFFIINLIRKLASRINSPIARSILTEVFLWLLYMPPITTGKIWSRLGFNTSKIPLYPFYEHMSLGRIRQDVYDRFFTRIEQRVSKEEIYKLSDTFSEVTISDSLPFWHFSCRR